MRLMSKAARSGRRFTVVLVGEDSLEANVGHLAALTGGEIFVAAGVDLADIITTARLAPDAADRHDADQRKAGADIRRPGRYGRHRGVARAAATSVAGNR